MIEHAKNITMRHEEKYICPETQLRIIESRLKGFLQSDANQGENGYDIQSVYFDTEADRFYEEGIEGLEYRNKYRIRIYNGNSDVIKLEKKTSIRNLKKKQTALVEKEFVQEILSNMEMPMLLEYEGKPVVRELLALQKTANLRPKAIVKYNRKAFVSDIGNVRITLDRDIRVSGEVENFFENGIVYHPILPAGIHLLEVKYDGVLPGYIAQLLNFDKLERTAFSKYVLGRETLKNNGRMSGLYEF